MNLSMNLSRQVWFPTFELANDKLVIKMLNVMFFYYHNGTLRKSKPTTGSMQSNMITSKYLFYNNDFKILIKLRN